MEVVNPLRTELIAYKDVLELETQWALTIIHTGGKTTVGLPLPVEKDGGSLNKDLASWEEISLTPIPLIINPKP